MTHPVKIPADVDRDDTILANFTARQVAVFAVTGIILYGGWEATRAFLPIVAYLILAIPVGVTVGAVVVVQRDGLTMDRLLLAALRQRMSPRRRVATGTPTPLPDWLSHLATDTDEISTAGLDLPAQGINGDGVLDLGHDGVALIAVVSAVNFALRTPGEQDALVSAFARYLHSLSAPIQILVRAARLDLSGQIAELHNQAPTLPHPALEDAAHDHARYLAHLAEHTDLLRRQIILVLREPLRAPSTDTTLAPGWRPRSRRTNAATHVEGGDATRRAATSRLVRRLTEAITLLSPIGITVTALDAGQATAVLAAACDPDTVISPSAGLASAHDVITTTPAASWDDDVNRYGVDERS